MRLDVFRGGGGEVLFKQKGYFLVVSDVEHISYLCFLKLLAVWMFVLYRLYTFFCCPAFKGTPPSPFICRFDVYVRFQTFLREMAV